MPTNTEIKVQILPNHPRHLAFFNQFGIHPSGNLVELHFAFGRSATDTFGGIVVIVTKDLLTAQKDSFLKYLKQIELPQESVAGKCRVREPKDVLFADFIGLARHGEMGEIACHAISWKAAVDFTTQAKSEKSEKKDDFSPVKADPVALLRSELDIHRNWISLLYESET